MATKKRDVQKHAFKELFPQVVAANLRRIRTGRRMSVETLARKAGCSVELVQQIEQAELQTPGIDEIARLATALKVDFTALVKRSGLKGA